VERQLGQRCPAVLLREGEVVWRQEWDQEGRNVVTAASFP
jgi:hypothetical protein